MNKVKVVACEEQIVCVCVCYIDCGSAVFLLHRPSLAAALQTCRIPGSFCTTLSVSMGVCVRLCLRVLFI